jgi:hypothetical protein
MEFTNCILFQHVNPKIKNFFGHHNIQELHNFLEFLEDASGKQLTLRAYPIHFAGNILLQGTISFDYWMKH